jgi:ABC-2 type transport system ATP-binding protein
MADEGAAVIFSSHDMTEVEELCTVLTVVDGGRVVFSGAVDDLRRRAPGTIHALRTSDDRAALGLARDRRALRVTLAEDTLEVIADVATLDAYVIALAHAGVAVRSLERRARSLEWLFLELTGTGEPPLPSMRFPHALRGDSRASSMAL